MTLSTGAVPPSVVTVDRDGHRGALVFEPFDSAFMGLTIGRVELPDDLGAAALNSLVRVMSPTGLDAGYDQLLRRVPAAGFDEIWALESAGYHLMDVGLTFARHVAPGIDHPRSRDVHVRAATPDDIEHLLATMLDVPWGSRYEADRAYDRTAVQRLQARWLRNSLEGRADHVLIGHVDGSPAGYVTCRLVEEFGEQIGEIDLVGTVPAARGRGVASTIVASALEWFATHVKLVTVRTQATNHKAAGVYERAGMTLRHSDMTFRLALTEQGGLS